MLGIYRWVQNFFILVSSAKAMPLILFALKKKVIYLFLLHNN